MDAMLSSGCAVRLGRFLGTAAPRATRDGFTPARGIETSRVLRQLLPREARALSRTPRAPRDGFAPARGIETSRVLRQLLPRGARARSRTPRATRDGFAPAR